MADIVKQKIETVAAEDSSLYEFSRIRHALRAELSRMHYRSLMRVENPKARKVYMNEAAGNA